MFNRTVRILDAGIRPVYVPNAAHRTAAPRQLARVCADKLWGFPASYVFDGKPPEMKGGELAKRCDARAAPRRALVRSPQAAPQPREEGGGGCSAA